MKTAPKTRSGPRTAPARPFYRDDPAEKARQGKGEFAGAEERARERERAKKKAAEAEVYDEPAERAPDPPTEAEIAQYVAALSVERRKKLAQLVELQVKADGYQNGTREGSALWERTRSVIVTRLIVHQGDLDEIDLSEVEE